ncbi:cation:proton antiporter subunit C [Rickettsiales bacterium]|nr:cation:proton antiporter subunit C [Rickettsiales bacterium]
MLYIAKHVYLVISLLLSIGFYGLIASTNLVKKLISLSVMQTSIILLYITLGYRGPNAVIPVAKGTSLIYTNPLPQVLMLTAIVVGLTVTTVGLALIIKLNKRFNSLDSKTIDKACTYDNVYHEGKNDDKEKNK